MYVSDVTIGAGKTTPLNVSLPAVPEATAAPGAAARRKPLAAATR